MNSALNTALSPALIWAEGYSPAGLVFRVGDTGRASCFHCGEACTNFTFTRNARTFCTRDCLGVHDRLAAAGLDYFYKLSPHPGMRIRTPSAPEQWKHLDDQEKQESQPDTWDHNRRRATPHVPRFTFHVSRFTPRVTRLTFHIPAIHGASCVWLLENLSRLHDGIGRSEVDFKRREANILFDPDHIKPSQLAALLASIGYPPVLPAGDVRNPQSASAPRSSWTRLRAAASALSNRLRVWTATTRSFLKRLAS